MAKKEKTNFDVIDGPDYSPTKADMLSISHNAEQFVLDFIGVTTQKNFDPYGAPFSNIFTHKTIIINAGRIKEFLKALEENIKKYEKNFSKLAEPKIIKKETKVIDMNENNYIG